MPRLLLFVILTWTTAAVAQDVPHDFKQDTPAVPGQVTEPRRERLRLAPLPLSADRSNELGLPSSGPKGLLRESYNEPKYDPPVGN